MDEFRREKAKEMTFSDPHRFEGSAFSRPSRRRTIQTDPVPHLSKHPTRIASTSDRSRTTRSVSSRPTLLPRSCAMARRESFRRSYTSSRSFEGDEGGGAFPFWFSYKNPFQPFNPRWERNPSLFLTHPKRGSNPPSNPSHEKKNREEKGSPLPFPFFLIGFGFHAHEMVLEFHIR